MARWYETQWARWAPVAAAGWFANFAVSYYADRQAQVFAPGVWPALFVVAAATAVAFAACPRSRRLWKLAGLVGFVALGSQVVRQVPNAFVDGIDVHDWSRWANICLWAGAAGMWWACWHYGVGEYHRYRRFDYEVS